MKELFTISFTTLGIIITYVMHSTSPLYIYTKDVL